MAKATNDPLTAQQAPVKPTTPPDAPETVPFVVSDYVTGSRSVASKVPDYVADVLEDLREVYPLGVTTASGVEVKANTVKFKTVTFPTAEAAEAFMRQARSYSKTVWDGKWSARLSKVSDTQVRVGVGPVTPKPRKPKDMEAVSA